MIDLILDAPDSDIQSQRCRQMKIKQDVKQALLHTKSSTRVKKTAELNAHIVGRRQGAMPFHRGMLEAKDVE